jgi:DNA-directed RNA polymerase specialized sigma24 family protein
LALMTEAPAPGPASRKPWRLTPEAFEHLLAALDSDRVIAGQRYEKLRFRLIQIFRWEGAMSPEECADEALDRAAKRLAEGEAVHDLERYLSRIARLLMLEERSAQRRERQALIELSSAMQGRDRSLELADALRACLAELPDSAREFLETYYSGDGQARIRQRKEMASSQKSALNAIRNRALRLRAKLENCARAKLNPR